MAAVILRTRTLCPALEGVLPKGLILFYLLGWKIASWRDSEGHGSSPESRSKHWAGHSVQACYWAGVLLRGHKLGANP